jgi:hypothetical protein
MLRLVEGGEILPIVVLGDGVEETRRIHLALEPVAAFLGGEIAKPRSLSLGIEAAGDPLMIEVDPAPQPPPSNGSATETPSTRTACRRRPPRMWTVLMVTPGWRLSTIWSRGTLQLPRRRCG